MKAGYLRLCDVARGAIGRAEDFRFVEIGCVSAAVKGRWAFGAKLRGAGHRKRLHVYKKSEHGIAAAKFPG